MKFQIYKYGSIKIQKHFLNSFIKLFFLIIKYFYVEIKFNISFTKTKVKDFYENERFLLKEFYPFLLEF